MIVKTNNGKTNVKPFLQGTEGEQHESLSEIQS